MNKLNQENCFGRPSGACIHPAVGYSIYRFGIRPICFHRVYVLFCNLFHRKEMAIIRLKGLIVSILLVCFFTTDPIAVLVSVTTLILTGTHLSSFAIFTLLLGFAAIRVTFCYNLSLCMQIASDSKVALDRIQTFLMEVMKFERIGQNHTQNGNFTVQNCKGEKKTKMAVQLLSYIKRDDYFQTSTGNSPSEQFIEPVTTELFSTNPVLEEPYVSILEASTSWNQEILNNTLNEITLMVRNSCLLGITGAVGSGKSSLLAAILGELPLHKGTISYHGKLAYVPQIPWVFSGTIRENILFGLPFNEERFQQVIHICELTKDLMNFTNGDLTEIGQRGVTLSGGQKARVGLARAVYSDAVIYLLDDPLSAVDTKVGRRLFESCLLGHLSGRIRLLVTHQIQYLKDVDRVVVMENGSIIHQGVYAELLHQGVFRGVSGLPEHCEDGPGFPKSFSSDAIYEKGIIKEELQDLLIPSVNTCDIPGDAQRQTLKQTLAEPVQDVKGIIDTLQQISTDWMVSSCSKVLAEGIDNGAIKEDNEVFGPNLQEKERVDQMLSEPFKNDDPGKIKKVLNEPSLSFVGGPREGQDNEAFVVDLALPKQKDAGVGTGVNVNAETILQPTSSLVLTNKCDSSDCDSKELSFFDLKEDEETKSAGAVTLRLYWGYFKQGLPVSRIVLLSVGLLVAQGKANFPKI